LINTALQQIDTYLLILMRVSGIFVIAPFWGNENLAMRARIGAVAMISFILLPMVGGTATIAATQWTSFAYHAVQELLIGVSIGFVGTIYFSMIYLVGTVVDRQTGFMLVQAIDPLSDTEVPMYGTFYNVIFIFLFLSINGHHMLLRGLVDSYELLPVGAMLHMSEDLVRFMIEQYRNVMILAFVLGSPVIIVSLLTNALLGIFAKTMPQINVFVVGMPLRIAGGMLTVWITLRAVVPFSERFFDRMFQSMYQWIQLLS